MVARSIPSRMGRGNSMMENYENLTLEQLKLYKASIEEYATISELLEVEKRIKELEERGE